MLYITNANAIINILSITAGYKEYRLPYVLRVLQRSQDTLVGLAGGGIWAVDSQESHKKCCQQMSDLKAKMHLNRFLLGSAPDSAGRAYSAAPDPSWI